MRTAMWAAAGLSTAVWLGAAPALAATERAQIKCELEQTGADDDAAGKVSMKLSGAKSSLDLKLSGLEPETEYEVEIEGLPEASFTSKRSGKASVSFRTRPKGRQQSLDFDPRGRTLTVSSAGDDVLAVELAPGSLEDGSVSDERVQIPATDLAPGAKVVATYRLRKDGRRDFKVEAERLAAGSYELYVGGILRGTLVTSGAKGHGELEFRDPVGDDDDKLPLDFDPSGQEITLAQGADIFATGLFLAGIPGVNECDASERELVLAPQPAAPVGSSAKAELATEDGCKRKLEVELEDVPVGDYDLFVGGVLRGVIHVTTTDSGTHGEIEFETQGSSDDDEEGEDELPLDFELANTAIEVAQADVVLFAGNTANATAGGPSACSEAPSEVQVALINSGADDDAKGKARYRVRDDCEHDFRVEIENLAAGGYDLLVGGVNRGTIEVELVAGELQGELEFDTDPDEPGEVLLDFDPRGLEVEVRRTGTTYLSRPFPAAE